MTTTTETTTTLRFKAEPLIRALSNGLLFAGKDLTRPSLCVIKFEFDGTSLTTVSTDSYRLCVETVEHTPDKDVEPFEFLLERDAATAALKVLKSAKRDPIELTYDGRTVGLRTLTSRSEWSTYEGTFPQYRSLIPDLDDAAPTDKIAFTASSLADLGKVLVDGKIQTVAVRLFGERKPTRVDYLRGPLVLLMPSRLAG
jgi:DNA polymerase III sliding clamp (beta) subunit (PCNA family)